MSALLEFHLARLTAKSATMPRVDFGGLPDVTVDDVQAALCSAPRHEYITVMARYTQGDIPVLRLLSTTIKTTRKTWHFDKRNYTVQVTTSKLDRLAQSVVLTFLNPFVKCDNQNMPRDDEWCAAWMDTSPENWASRYRHHYAKVMATVIDPYLNGCRRVRAYLRH